jgi:hypothetical protein
VDEPLPPTPVQRAAGQRCLQHADIVQAMTSVGDVDGALGYLGHVERAEGPQMARNIEHVLALRLSILPPDVL